MAIRKRRNNLDELIDENSVEYVDCPVCRGSGRNCRFCESFGDVHPDDVGPILRAYDSDRRAKLILTGVGAFLFTGVLVTVFMIVRGNVEKRESGTETGIKTDDGTSTGGGSASDTKKKSNLPPGYSTEIRTLIADMRISLKVKQYDEVIQKCQAALPNAKDDIQRRNLLDLIKSAQLGKEKAGG